MNAPFEGNPQGASFNGGGGKKGEISKNYNLSEKKVKDVWIYPPINQINDILRPFYNKSGKRKKKGNGFKLGRGKFCWGNLSAGADHNDSVQEKNAAWDRWRAGGMGKKSL